MNARACLLVVALAPQGCVVWHGQTNAPGVAPPREAPSPDELAREELSVPRDPGEHVVTVSPGPFIGGGATSGGAGVSRVGAELSLAYGTSENSHKDDFLVMPKEAVGVNLGVVPVEQGRLAERPAMYGEAQVRSEVSGLAAGWSVRPGVGGGPQVTAFYGPLYMRSTTTLGEGTAFTAGLMLKWPMAFVWSR